jgi:hypothetical protein
MAEADLDAVIRQTAKVQNKSLIAAVEKRRDQIMARAAKAKDKETRDQLRLMAKSTMLLGTAAVKRLQNSAEIAADAYARAIRHAAEEATEAAAKPAKKKDGGKASGKRSGKKSGISVNWTRINVQRAGPVAR